MSDKKDKGYDATLLRAVGNILAGSSLYQQYLNSDSLEEAKLFRVKVIHQVIHVRDSLRKIQKIEEKEG